MLICVCCLFPQFVCAFQRPDCHSHTLDCTNKSVQDEGDRRRVRLAKNCFGTLTSRMALNRRQTFSHRLQMAWLDDAARDAFNLEDSGFGFLSFLFIYFLFGEEGLPVAAQSSLTLH